jgi:hypothetical protein
LTLPRLTALFKNKMICENNDFNTYLIIIIIIGKDTISLMHGVCVCVYSWDKPCP